MPCPFNDLSDDLIGNIIAYLRPTEVLNNTVVGQLYERGAKSTTELTLYSWNSEIKDLATILRPCVNLQRLRLPHPQGAWSERECLMVFKELPAILPTMVKLKSLAIPHEFASLPSFADMIHRHVDNEGFKEMTELIISGDKTSDIEGSLLLDISKACPSLERAVFSCNVLFKDRHDEPMSIAETMLSRCPRLSTLVIPRGWEGFWHKAKVSSHRSNLCLVLNYGAGRDTEALTSIGRLPIVPPVEVGDRVRVYNRKDGLVKRRSGRKWYISLDDGTETITNRCFIAGRYTYVDYARKTS